MTELDNNRKAWRITTTADGIRGFSIVSAINPGKAKTTVINQIREAYYKGTYSWIISCRRAPEYDELAHKYSGTIAWHHDRENWEQDRGRWSDSETKPMTAEERTECLR